MAPTTRTKMNKENSTRNTHTTQTLISQNSYKLLDDDEEEEEEEEEEEGEEEEEEEEREVVYMEEEDYYMEEEDEIDLRHYPPFAASAPKRIKKKHKKCCTTSPTDTSLDDLRYALKYVEIAYNKIPVEMLLKRQSIWGIRQKIEKIL